MNYLPYGHNNHGGHERTKIRLLCAHFRSVIKEMKNRGETERQRNIQRQRFPAK